MNAIHDVPRLRVMIDGTAIETGQASALRRLRVVQALSTPAQCELVLQAPDAQLTGDGIAPGTSLAIELEDHDTPLFSGEVTAVEQVYTASRGVELRIRGYDPLHRLQKRQSARALTDVDPAAVARQLLSDAGISAGVEDDGTELSWPLLLQHDQTDFELLSEICERTGLYFVLRGDTLHLLTLEGVSGDESLELTLGDDLLEATFELNAAPVCRRVVARGWDPGRAVAIEGQADSPRTGRVASARVALSDVGAGDERLIGGVSGATEAHTQLIAQAELDRATASELTVRGTALGDPDLRPGTGIEISGVAGRLEGTYIVTDAIHTIDPETGYLVALSSAPPAPRPPRRAAMGMALATVTSADDPDKLGRVRVRLPAFGGIETGWLQVMSLGAGAKKGLSIVPDADDQVLVSLVHGELGQAIVLGGLYGDDNPDPGIEGGSVRRFSLQTSGGQRLYFDDNNRTLRITDAKGSYLELGPDGVKLHSEVPLTIEAPGQSLTFRASSIDFKKA